MAANHCEWQTRTGVMWQEVEDTSSGTEFCAMRFANASFVDLSELECSVQVAVATRKHFALCT
jgi:hypothetical protein